MGEEMAKRKKEKKEEIDWLLWIVIGLIAILILKGLGLLKLWFNIDPEGFTLSIDIGYIASATLFIYVLTRMHKLNDMLSKQCERIATIEGMLTKKTKGSSVSE